MIECRNLSTGYPRALVSEHIDLAVKEGELVSLIGPNGCGKTTLLKTMAGLLPPRSGQVVLEGDVVSQTAERALARRRAYLPQLREVPDITVAALVAHGRFPHLGFSRKMTAHDRDCVERAMELTGVVRWRGRRLKELSGGQRQRVYLAMSVAQETPLLLWDEPTTYLDINNRLTIMELARKLNHAGRTVIMTLHDLADALTVSDRVCLMDADGAVRIAAAPEEVFASRQIDQVFGIRSEQITLHDGTISYVFTSKRNDI